MPRTTKTKSVAGVTFAVSKGVHDSNVQQQAIALRQQQLAAARGGATQGTVEAGYDLADNVYPTKARRAKQPRYVATGRTNACDGDIGERTRLSDAWDLHLCTVPAFQRAGVALMEKLGIRTLVFKVDRSIEGGDAGGSSKLASSIVIGLSPYNVPSVMAELKWALVGRGAGGQKLIGPIIDNTYYTASAKAADPLDPAHPQLMTPLRALVMTQGHLFITNIRIDTLSKAAYSWARDHAKRILAAAGYAVAEEYPAFDNVDHPLNPHHQDYEDNLIKALILIDKDAEAGRRFREDTDKEDPTADAWFIKDVLATCSAEGRTLVRWWGYGDGGSSWEPTDWIKAADLIWKIWEATPKLNMERGGTFQQEYVGVGQNLGVEGNNESIAERGLLLHPDFGKTVTVPPLPPVPTSDEIDFDDEY